MLCGIIVICCGLILIMFSLVSRCRWLSFGMISSLLLVL